MFLQTFDTTLTHLSGTRRTHWVIPLDLLEEESIMNRAPTFSGSRTLAVCGLVLLLALSFTPSAAAQSQPSIQPLFSFACSSNTNVCPNGKSPNTLIQSADGNFYGTTPTSGIRRSTLHDREARNPEIRPGFLLLFATCNQVH